MAKKPSAEWFSRMDDVYVNQKISNKSVRKQLGSSFPRFHVWCRRVIAEQGWPGTQHLIDNFLAGDFMGCRVDRLQDVDPDRWKKLTAKVFLRDNYTCVYCGRVGGVLEVDHKQPFSREGTDTLDNLATACRHCNRQKHDKTFAEYIEWRGKHE